jgi:hypothetical protein
MDVENIALSPRERAKIRSWCFSSGKGHKERRGRCVRRKMWDTAQVYV